MERIGLAASKIAKGNLLFYNLSVVLISILFSLFIFIIAGSTVLFALIVIAYVGSEVMPAEFEKNWMSVFSVCMAALTIITAVFNLFAISKNLKFRKDKN